MATDLTAYSDVQLVELYQQCGEGKYVGALYKRHIKMVLLICYKYLKDKEIAKEAVMQVFENLICYLKKYSISNFKSWLTTVTRNHCYMMLRSDKGIVEYCDIFKKNVEEYVEFEDVFTLNCKEEEEKRYENLENAIENLPNEQRECIKLFYWKGNTYSQITQITGYDYKQIKSYLQNGRRTLKKVLSHQELTIFLLMALTFIVKF